MDFLINSCKNLTIHNNNEWINNTQWDLECITTSDEETHVITKNFIPNGSFIGEIVGERKYCWEIIPSKYTVWVEDEFIIDCEKTPRCITSMIQEGFYEGFESNCELINYVLYNDLKIAIYSRKDIQINEELIFKRTNKYY
jgi:hypothetical protein